MRWLARRHGALPGHRLGFGGREATSLIGDWVHNGLSGRYRHRGSNEDLEQALANVEVPISAIVLMDDWLAPPGSLDFLLQKMPRTAPQTLYFDEEALGAPADHFSWIKHSRPIAATLAASIGH